MLFRRLVAALVVLGVLAAVSVPAALGQKEKEKTKDKGKKKDKDKKKKGKGAEDEDKGDEDKKAGPALKWKFEKGKTFYQKMTTVTKQTMKVMNNDVNQTQDQTFYFSWTPTKVDNDKGTAIIEQEIIGVAMKIEIGGSTISYDSTKDATANNPLGDFFKALVGSKFTITLNTRDYKVTKMDGRKEFIQKLTAANPGMKQLLETILSEEALKEMAEPTFAVVPPKAGDKKWTRKTTLNMGPIGTYENTYNYTLEKTSGASDKQTAQIKVETVLNYKEPGDAAGQGGLPFKIKSAKLKSKNPSGTVTFDMSKGRVEKSKMNLELTGTLQIEIGGQTTPVDLSQTQESTVQTYDDNPLPKKGK